MWTPLWKSAVKAIFQKKFLFVYLLTKMCVISRNLHHVFEEFQHISINHMMAIILKYWGQTSFHGTKWRPARWMLKDHFINIVHADYLCCMPDMLSINPGKFGKQCNTVPKRVIQYWNCLHGLLEKIFNVQKKTSW